MVIIYGAEWCSFCKKAKELCQDYGIGYEWRNVDDPEYKEELKLKLPDVKTIPQIYWHHRYIGGYQELATTIEEDNIGNYGQGTF